jgi:putative Ca2+/H+ antiporter (TMEM165/GDT1 family)
MLVANVPVVSAADKVVSRIPLKRVRSIAAALFVALGIAVLVA